MDRREVRRSAPRMKTRVREHCFIKESVYCARLKNESQELQRGFLYIKDAVWGGPVYELCFTRQPQRHIVYQRISLVQTSFSRHSTFERAGRTPTTRTLPYARRTRSGRHTRSTYREAQVRMSKERALPSTSSSSPTRAPTRL